MALNYREANNGYPIALISSVNLPMVRPSQATNLFEGSQLEYAGFVDSALNSKKAIKKANRFGRRILTVNTGTNLIKSLASKLDLGGRDTLYVLEQQSQRTEATSRLAERLQLNPVTFVIGEGNFLTGSFFNMMDLTSQRLDVVVFGLGTPSTDRSRKDGSCRVQAEIAKSVELLREGGSLLMSPALIDAFCVEEALRNNRLLRDPEREIQRIANTRAMRVVAMR